MASDQHDETLGGVQKPAMLALLKYLFTLSDDLPEKQREEFLQSTARLEMKHLIDTLEIGRE
ncbi:MAG: hypothetical protein LBS86_02965 [Treponema sp.]|jgi:hypothetical protein|nr:hypothetical protein [Treponema sp.]